MFASSARLLAIAALLVVSVLASPLSSSMKENAAGKSDYGSDSAHKNNFHKDSETSGHDIGHKGYYNDGKGNSHDDYAHDGAKKKQNKEEHDSATGSKYVDDAADYNKNVKTKTFGFFDYHYVQPQYHMEQYHTDEKHADKYAGDEHAAGQKHNNKGGYHADGYEGFDKAQAKHGASNSEYGREDDDHKKTFEDKDGKYGGHSDGYYNKGYNGYGHGKEHESYQPATYYNSQPKYGYNEPHYGAHHGHYDEQPYYGYNSKQY